jgi:hypothetical protein
MLCTGVNAKNDPRMTKRHLLQSCNICLTVFLPTTAHTSIRSCPQQSRMPTHESPPPSIRGFNPTSRSRAPSPTSRPDTPSAHLPSSRSSIRWGILGGDKASKKHVTIQEPNDKGTAWYAGFGAARILGHRWFAWIGPKIKWKFLKPVIRCSIAVSHRYKVEADCRYG